MKKIFIAFFISLFVLASSPGLANSDTNSIKSYTNSYTNSFASNLMLAQDGPQGALHLVTYQDLGFRIDGSEHGLRVRKIIEEAKAMGFSSIVFNFRAHMVTGTGMDIRSTVPVNLQGREEYQLIETAKYAQSKGLKVAFRPILMVVGPKGEFPYTYKGVYWWHGNIKPTNVDKWFESFYNFHFRYLKIAKQVGAEWYSVGAEMNSMTSGLGDRDKTWRFGYPQKWVELIQKARQVLGPSVAITYGVNYTDQYILADGNKLWGGEIEQWKYYLTTEFKTEAYQKHQKAMQVLWSSLDIIGIDYYRALAGANQVFSKDHDSLVKQLTPRPLSHADQLDSFLTEMAITTGIEKPVFYQEVGYRSSEKSFLNPSQYEGEGGPFNPLHQAAAWEAFFKAYFEPQWPWMKGVGVWQVLVDESTELQGNKGFTPFGKPEFKRVLQKYLKK